MEMYIDMEFASTFSSVVKVVFVSLTIFVIIRSLVMITKGIFIEPYKYNDKNKDIKNTKSEKTKSLVDEYKREKITSYVEKMSLSEVMQLIPEGILKNIPKKRDILNETLINEIMCGKIDFKEGDGIYYVNSDKILENDRDYYIEGIKEKKDDLLHLESIRKNDGIVVNMPTFGQERLLDNNETLWTMLAKDLEKMQDDGERNILSELNIKENDDNEEKIEDTIYQDSWSDHNKINMECVEKNMDFMDNFAEKLPENEDFNNFNDKVIEVLKLSPTKENLPYFTALLDEYTLLDFDTKCSLGRKYISELETLKNKAERSNI